jgi:hypothetical protein
MRINVGFSLSHENFCVLFQFSFPTPLCFFFFFCRRISLPRSSSQAVSGNGVGQKISLKINLNILIFYITSVIFYYYSNKKIITKQNFLLFLTKYSYFFSLHQSNMLQYRSTSSNPFLCQT